MDKLQDILKEYWGYDSFRPLQREIIESVISGNDTLAILPTGGGKSLTYQLPALFLGGVTIVISPLISLMTDQVQQLRRRGIKAVVIHSGLRHDRILDIMEQAQLGAYNLIYVSPERLSSELFMTRLRFLNVSLIAVDEAHCISQWGYDFRPSYLKISSVRKLFPSVPCLALTASATPVVADDIVFNLKISDSDNFTRFRQSVSRSNLTYAVRLNEDRMGMLNHILTSVPGTAIVYTRTREAAELVSEALHAIGHSVSFYHAGLDRQQRDERQELWRQDKIRILCATNAFGMGIDKPDVRLVVHYDIPDNLEAYYQEAGRAGRDGKRAYAVLLATEATLSALLRRHESAFPSKEYVRTVYQRLAEFYVIGVDSGRGAIFPFSLEEFCASMRLQYGAVRSALRILEWAGYITVTEEMEDASKLRILVTPDDVFQWRQSHVGDDRILEAIMRQYTGIFTDARHISEDYIAQILHITRDDVYNHLRALHRERIVQYVPFKRTPLIIYNTERLDSEDLYLPPEAYERRKEHLRDRLRYVYDYFVDKNTCRTQILARYFGEEDSEPCHICDNCLSHKA